MVNLSWIRVTCVLRQWSGGLSHTTHPEGLQKVADALRSDDATGLLKQICESWIYLYHLPVLCSRHERAKPERVSLRIFVVSTRVQPQPAVSRGWADGAGLSVSDRPNARIHGFGQGENHGFGQGENHPDRKSTR